MPDFSAYTKAGWRLCAIDTGTKGPTYKAWNVEGMPEDALVDLPGAGLLHVLSGTCSIDIDNLELARPWLAERGVDIDGILAAEDAVRIDSGRRGRAKLLYRMRKPLRTLKPKGSGLELRCATAEGLSVQDVLPPSIHPDTGKPYQWAYGEPLIGHWSALPPIPAGLLNVWRGLTDDEASPEPVAAKPKPTGVVAELAKLRKAAFKHDPNCDDEEWLKVGMQLHEATGGAEEGLDIWNDWSKQATRKQHGKDNLVYPGRAALKARWLSFKSAPGKRVVTGAALVAELPAEADEFPDEKPEPESAEAPAELPPGTRPAALAKLIKRFVFVVANEEYFDTERNTIIGDKAIKHLLTPYMPKKSGREVDPIDQLMRARGKTSVEALAFHPGEESLFKFNGRTYANTFFAASIPEPIVPTALEMQKIEWLFNRIDDVDFREWLRQFYAHIVQRPALKIRTAPLIWSKIQGNGKSTIAHTIPQLLVGHEYYVGANQNALNSDFNDYLIGKWLVALTEFRANSRSDRESISKKTEEWIADDMLTLTIKGGRGYSVPNHLVVTASTNSSDAAAIDENNRKWAIHKFDVPPMSEDEKKWLFEEFLRTDRARGVLRHYFLNVPITTFNPNADAPKTKARQDMVTASMGLDTELLITAFEERSEPLARDVVLTRDVGDYVRRHCVAKPSNNRIGHLLCDAPFGGKAIQFRVGEAVYRGVILRNHAFWGACTGREIMAHIAGDDADLTA